jgi:hypothetical protein
MLERYFKTRSWTRVETKTPIQELRDGWMAMREQLRRDHPPVTAAKLEQDDKSNGKAPDEGADQEAGAADAPAVAGS